MNATATRHPLDDPDLINELPWNLWRTSVVKEGADDDLARLGRAAMRGAYLSYWPQETRYLTNFNLMTRLALEAPATARQLWQLLLDTDGLAWTTAETDEREPIDFRIPTRSCKHLAK